MSHAGVFRALAAIVAIVGVASLSSCFGDKTNIANVNQSVPATLEALAPDTDTVHVNFACGTVDSLSLTAGSGSGWAVQRHPNQPITWAVGPAVAINAIAGKTEALPIDTILGDPHGHTPGTPYKAKVKNNPGVPPGQQKIFPYTIDLTCHPGQPDSVRLLLDPEFIVKKP